MTEYSVDEQYLIKVSEHMPDEEELPLISVDTGLWEEW